MANYVIGNDKSLTEVTEVCLDKKGGVMEGGIRYKGSKGTSNAIKFLDNTVDQNGNGIDICAGGLTIIASGEAGEKIEGIETPGTEKVVIASDNNIEFYTGVQNGLDSASKVILNASGIFSNHQKKITSGTAAPTGGSNGDIYIQY